MGLLFGILIQLSQHVACQEHYSVTNTAFTVMRTNRFTGYVLVRGTLFKSNETSSSLFNATIVRDTGIGPTG